jgi:hypothetical protein
MFPRQAWLDIGGYPEAFNDGREDWAVNIALGIHGYCGIYIDEPGCLYRRENHNRTLRNTSPKKHQYFLDKLRKTFPDIYKGERPMGCCGGTKTAPTVKVSPTTKKIVAGADGTTTLEYIGDSWGTISFYGPTTGARYTAGKSKPYVNVDPRDLNTTTASRPGLLQIKDKGRPLFQVYSLKPTVQKEAEVKPAEPQEVSPEVEEPKPRKPRAKKVVNE